MTAIIKHTDGVTNIKAKVVLVTADIVELEYRFEGMSYSATYPTQNAIKMGIIKI